MNMQELNQLLWLEELDKRIYLSTGDGLRPLDRDSAQIWYINHLTPDQALLMWLQRHTLG